VKIHWEVSQKARNTYTIFLDDDAWGDVSTTIFGKKPSFPKEVDTLDAWEELFKRTELAKTKSFALKKLSIRSYSSHEMKSLLAKANVSQEAISAVIDVCKEYGYLNDTSWLENFIRMESQKKRGPTIIAQKLRHIGFPQNDIREALQTLSSPDDQKQQILTLLHTKYKSRNLQERKDKEKTIGALLRRGFDLDLVREVLESTR